MKLYIKKSRIKITLRAKRSVYGLFLKSEEGTTSSWRGQGLTVHKFEYSSVASSLGLVIDFAYY